MPFLRCGQQAQHSVLVLSLIMAPAVSAQQTRKCAPPLSSLESSAHFALRPGRYWLVLVATHGSRAGGTGAGTLELRRAGTTDRSPAHPSERPPGETRRLPLYGWTDLDFSRVGAPVSMRGDGSVPAPRSRDPLHPGVVVLGNQPPAGVPPHPPELLVGTLWNRRVNDGLIGLDGPGIHLSVQYQRGNEATGGWGPWGRRVDGSGYFCLFRDDPT